MEVKKIEGKTSTITIFVDPNFRGAQYVQKSWYTKNVKGYLDFMNRDYTFNPENSTFIISADENEADRLSFEEVFDLYRDDNQLPAWLSISISNNSSL